MIKILLQTKDSLEKIQKAGAVIVCQRALFIFIILVRITKVSNHSKKIMSVVSGKIGDLNIYLRI